MIHVSGGSASDDHALEADAPPVGAAEFAARMAPLGPFEPRPRLALAVSGGPDSMALALLAKTWAAERGGAVLALIVDHRLRADSTKEAAEVRGRLRAEEIPVSILTLDHLAHGPALAERARAARYTALEAACRRAGIAHLLLGHHAADQAETVLMRALAGSKEGGLAGMASLSERPSLRLLRPLLGVPPGRLVTTLRQAGWSWVSDPTNSDPTATRARIRMARLDRLGIGPATSALTRAARAEGERRSVAERELMAVLAAAVTIRPEGFALLEPGRLPVPALRALISTIAGRAFPPSSARIEALAQAPRPATIGGVRLILAGRFGPGLLVVREGAAMGPPVPARVGAVWDGRFRVARVAALPIAGPRRATVPMVGALGGSAARVRKLTPLPSVVLSTLPAIWHDRELVCIPHLAWPNRATAEGYGMLFAPPRPLGPAPFVPG